MPKLFDATALGPRSTPESKRPLASFGKKSAGQAQRAIKEGAEASAKLARQTSQTLFALAGDLGEARDRREVAHAKAAFTTAKTEAESELANDQDYTTYEARYGDRIKAAEQNALGMITSSRTRELFQASLQDDIARGFGKVQDLAFAKESDANIASLNELLEGNRNNALKSSDPQTRTSYIESTKVAVDAARDAGYITATTAQKTLQEWTQGYAEADLGMRPAGEQLRLIAENKGPASLLPEDRKQAFREQAQRVVNLEMREERNRVAALTDDDLASLQMTGQGVPGVVDRAAKVFDEDEMTAFLDKRDRARRVHSATEAFKIQPTQDIVRTLETLEPTPGAKTFADDQRAYETAQRAASQIIAQRQKDPAQAAQDQQGLVSPFDAREDPSAFRTALKARRNAQESIGVQPFNQRVLTGQEAKAEAQAFQGASAEDRAALMLDMQNRYGELFPAAFEEVVDAGLDPRNKILALVADDPVLSQQVAQVIDTTNKELFKTLEGTVKTDITAGIRGAMAEFRETFMAADMTGLNIEQYNELESVVRDLAALYVQQGADPADAAERAAENTINGRFDFIVSEKARAYVPKTLNGQFVNLSQVRGHADRMATEDAIKAFDPEPFGSVSESLPEFLLKDRTLRAAVNSGFWVTDEDGEGMIYMVPFSGGGALPLVNRQGEPYRIGFLEATNRPLPRPEAPIMGGEAVRVE